MSSSPELSNHRSIKGAKALLSSPSIAGHTPARVRDMALHTGETLSVIHSRRAAARVIYCRCARMINSSCCARDVLHLEEYFRV